MKAINKNNESVNVVVINASLLQAAEEIGIASFAHIEYKGEEKLPKKLGISGIVTKHTIGSVQMRYPYENGVNNRLERQGDERTFKAEPLPFGKWFIPSLFIANKGKTYLRFYLFAGGHLETTYYVNGREATPEEAALIKAYKANKEKSDKQERAGLTANQVMPKTLETTNLLALDCGNYHYRWNAQAIAELNEAAEAATAK